MSLQCPECDSRDLFTAWSDEHHAQQTTCRSCGYTDFPSAFRIDLPLPGALSPRLGGWYDAYLDLPIIQGLICQVTANGTPATNIPHFAVWHSPTGYSFGYAGSGPADLALNTLETLLRYLRWQEHRDVHFRGSTFKTASRLHQAFKAQFIAPIPQNQGGLVPFEQMTQWLNTQNIRLADN